jgi:hypothetical protein
VMWITLTSLQQKTNRDLLSDWLCILVKPLIWFRFEHVLFPVFADCEPAVDCIASFPRYRPGNKSSISTLEGIKSHREDLMKCKPRDTHG